MVRSWGSGPAEKAGVQALTTWGRNPAPPNHIQTAVLLLPILQPQAGTSGRTGEEKEVSPVQCENQVDESCPLRDQDTSEGSRSPASYRAWSQLPI